MCCIQIGELIAVDDVPRKLVVLCSAAGEERARIVLHFLRRMGHDTLAFPVPDGAPTLANVKKVVEFSRRVGVEGFVGFGGGGMLNLAKVRTMVCYV